MGFRPRDWLAIHINALYENIPIIPTPPESTKSWNTPGGIFDRPALVVVDSLVVEALAGLLDVAVASATLTPKLVAVITLPLAVVL